MVALNGYRLRMRLWLWLQLRLHSSSALNTWLNDSIWSEVEHSIWAQSDRHGHVVAWVTMSTTMDRHT